MKQIKYRIICCKISVPIFIVAIVFSLKALVWADNPIVQTIFTADPAPMIHNGVCYVYTTHDEDVLVNNFFTMNDWRCYSSTDMVNWTDLGSPLSYTDFSWASGDAWAGQCIHRNGKFYFYVPIARKAGGKAIGVAVATNPAGPYSDPLGHPLVGDDGSWGDIDPTVFIDDDGQAYLYWGNPYLHYVTLNQDMISYSGGVVDVPLTPESFGVRTDTDRPSQYEEGPWFYKRNGLYYMVFAAGPISEHISYSTSPGPTGPWTFGGVIMPTQGGSFTNHPGVCDYQGNSYFFYHNGALPDGHGFHRSVCVEKFTYNADGTFPTINMTTAGPPQISYLNPFIRTEAETICWESGIETEVCSEGGMNVTSISNGDWIRVRGVDFLTGANSFQASVASAGGGGSIELRLDSVTGTLIGTCVVPNTGGNQTWTTVICAVSGASGVHDLYLRFTGSGEDLFNLDWWQFQTDSLIFSTINVNSSALYQTIEGLGGAVCFYNGWFTAHPYKQEIFDYAFSGLNLSMLRVGNWWRGTNGQDNATYEIVAAANQRLGRPVPILMSSWSPPAYLKSNGEVANGGTLIQINGAYDYAGFADYWYDSLQDYIARGVIPTWIGIQNEPDWTADYDSCRFDPSEGQYASFALAQDAVYNMLQSMTSPPKLLGPECVGLYGNAAGLRNYMAQMNANTFYGIAHHLYGGSTDGTPDGYNSAFTTILNSSNTLFPGKPRFMTEFGDIKGLIPCANLIHNSLVVEQVSGYNHWCLMWPGDIGLVEIENPWGSGSWTNPKGYWLNQSYWSMKHYSYYIQPGFRRVNAVSGNSDVLVSSYLSPDSKRLVTVLINRNATNAVYVTLNSGSFTYDSSNVYQTAGEDHFKSLGPVVGSRLLLPASSLTTVVLDHYGPLAPSGLSATVIVDSQVNLAWMASPGAPSYNVKRSTVSGGPYTTIAANITATSFCDTAVTSGQTYYYVVSANTSGGESANSSEATPSRVRTYLKFNESGGTTATDATGNGRNGTLVNGPLWSTSGKFSNAVDLDGTNDHVTLPTGVVNGLTDFTVSVWAYLDTISNWSRVFDFGTGTSVNMFLTPRNGVTGAVRFAITTGGAGGEQQITGSSALPTGTWTHVAVTLSGNTGILYVNGAEVGRNSSMSRTPSSLGATTQNYIGRSQYSDPYLDGRVDEFRIYAAALSAAGVASLYAEQIPAAIPSTPTGLSATAITGSQIDLTWNASANTTNYNIKRSTTSGGPYTMVTGVSGTSYSDTGLSELTTYYYVVSAVNSVGQSADSTQADAMTQSAPPAAPTGLTATAGDCSVALNWNANSEADLAGYNVYRSTTLGSGYIQLNSSLLNSPEFTDNDVSYYITYYYVVTAVDTYDYESSYSNEVSVTPTDSSIVQFSAADFESGFGEWVNITTGDDSHDWTRYSGSTLTPNTGPSGGENSSTWYVYLETSPGGANTAGNTAILQGPMIDGYHRVLTFYYHMYGAATGTLNVDVFHNGTWQNAVWTLSGQQQSSNGAEYIQAAVDLNSYIGPIQIRFRAMAAGGPTGDMAIDSIEVTGRVLYGDMNGDNIVNADDLSEFAGYWLQEDCDLDLDGDCLVNLYEFTAFAENWLWD
jgi:O-glycosyl hydrolase